MRGTWKGAGDIEVQEEQAVTHQRRLIVASAEIASSCARAVDPLGNFRTVRILGRRLPGHREGVRKKIPFTEQMVKSLPEAGKALVAEVAGRHGVSNQAIYGWREKCDRNLRQRPQVQGTKSCPPFRGKERGRRVGQRPVIAQADVAIGLISGIAWFDV